MSEAGSLTTEPQRSDLNLTVWTPLPPQASGIAAYNSELLLPALARLARVNVVVDDDVAPLVRPDAPYTVIPWSARQLHADPKTVCIYHMGNHGGLHGAIHDALLEESGLLVLHDPSLYDFYRLYHQLGPGFEEELRYNYGDGEWTQQWNDLQQVPDRLSLRVERRVVEASRAVIVHSVWARDALASRFLDTPVFHVPLAASARTPSGEGPDIRGRFGWTDEHVVFGLIGAIAAHKRVAETVRLFAAAHKVQPATRLLVSGRVDWEDELVRLREVIDALGVRDAVRIVPDAEPAEFDACVQACDAIVDLRCVTAGEVPASLVQAFAAGKPAIVSDLPQLREFDERFCRRVPTDATEGTRAAVQQMIAVARDRIATHDAGVAARRYIEDTGATPDAVAARYVEIIRSLPERDGASPSAKTCGLTLRHPIGVNAIGDFEATTGLMEAGRRIVSALASAGADVELTAIEIPAAGRSRTRRQHDLEHLRRGRSHPIDVWLYNMHEFGLVTDDDLTPDGAGRYTIGNWAWELPRVHPPFDAQIPRVDEIWVPSRFVREAFSASAPAGMPITVVPHLVDVPPPPRVSRAEFGLPEDATIFFFSFDARSSPARKNPWAIIEAFERAFDERERSGPARLAFKVNNLDYVSALRTPFEAALARVNGILIDAELAREQMNGLLAAVDVYVSLHRAEGFGLGMAEAMFLGKPAIVTAYSGNLDFTDAGNSCLVGYRLRPIDESDHGLFRDAADTYIPGVPWAEPSVDQAARWMRFLYDRPDMRERVGRAAAATIQRRCSREAVQRVLVGRLEAIQQSLDARSAA
jgi:glycosyltransferase involved in cell wall biosynthesis